MNKCRKPVPSIRFLQFAALTHAISLMLLFSLSPSIFASTQVLVIGGSEGYMTSQGQPFTPLPVADHLRAILEQDSNVSSRSQCNWRTRQQNGRSWRGIIGRISAVGLPLCSRRSGITSFFWKTHFSLRGIPQFFSRDLSELDHAGHKRFPGNFLTKTRPPSAVEFAERH